MGKWWGSYREIIGEIGKILRETKVFCNSSSFAFFFLIGVHSKQGWTATTKHGVTRKRSKKRLKYTGNLMRKNLQLKDVC